MVTAASRMSACKWGQETGVGGALPCEQVSHLILGFPLVSTAAVRAGRVACAMNVSPTMAVAMAPAASPGSVPVRRAGEVCFVTKVSEGRRDGVAGPETRDGDWIPFLVVNK